jgi:predicted kinase
MARMIILRGIPGSGKSTWRDESGLSFVNMDTLRQECRGYSEREVRIVHDERILFFLDKGIDFIIDNTHIKNHSYQKYLAWAGEAGYETYVKLFKTDLQTCIERNSQRDNPVPLSVLLRMAHDFGYDLQNVFRIEPDHYGQIPAIIVDLDGAFCDSESVASITQKFYDSTLILLVSGREETYRAQTETWLEEHQVPYDWLLMRTVGDPTDDALVKEALFSTYVAPYCRVLFCVNDLLSVCQT